jgi:putative transposase
MDLVSDALFDSRKFRVLTVVDNFALECPAIAVGQSLTGEDVFGWSHKFLAIETNIQYK